MNKLFKSSSLVIGATLSLSLSSVANADNISLDMLTKDITYLASDQLNGRASFSKDIDKAADYISQRYQEIGLKPLKGLSSFKQTFTITNIAPKSISVSLNGVEISQSHLGMASTIENIHWTSTTDFTTHVVGKDDNMRALLGEVNLTGGKHVLLINSAHEKMFKGYSGYFARGLNKIAIDHQGAIILIFSDETSIENIEINASTVFTEQTLTNIVGVLPGDSQKDEVVLYSAHYDHLGATPTSEDNDDVIYNGADDDASGTAAIINLAEYFAKKGKNARSLMFSAFTAEEIGGFGSRFFSQQLNADSVIAMINIEMIGKPSKFGKGSVWMTGMERSNLGELLNKNLKDQSSKIHQDPYPEQNLFYRSDNATLARLGVPAHSFSSTQLDKDQFYHTVKDDLASLDLDSMHQVVEGLSVATQGLVDGKLTPTRVDVSKVKGHGKIY